MRFQRTGVSNKVLAGLTERALATGEISLERLLVDESFPPSGLGGQQVAHGHKGKGAALHLVADAHGYPLRGISTAANVDERRQLILC